MLRNVLAILGALALPTLLHAAPFPKLTAIHLHSGENKISNIAGDGVNGSINVFWTDNGNAWGHEEYVVVAGGSTTMVIDTKKNDQPDGPLMIASPHTGEDFITSVRFARGMFEGKRTLFLIRAERDLAKAKGNCVPCLAPTKFFLYTLIKAEGGVGGAPYAFVFLKAVDAKHLYSDADQALHAELGFPLKLRYEYPANEVKR